MDRRWCGTDEEGNIPDSDADLEHDSDVTRPSDAETSADDTGDVEAPEGLGADRSTARVRDRGMLNSVPQDMYYHSFEPVSSGIRPHADYDEEISDDTLDEAARSRSRSPKGLGTAEPRRSRLRLTGVHDRDRDPSRPPRDSAAYRTRSSSRARYHRQLRAAAPVKIGGVTIGRVSKVDLDPVKLDSIVTLAIDSRFQELPIDTSACLLYTSPSPRD